jgi:hypothetical protein
MYTLTLEGKCYDHLFYMSRLDVMGIFMVNVIIYFDEYFEMDCEWWLM